MAHKYRPVSYSEASRSASRVTVDDGDDGRGYSRSYAEVINYIDRFMKNPNEKVTTDPYASLISNFEFRYVELCQREQTLVREYLGSKCPVIPNLSPGTVGAYICGCFKNGSFYPGGNKECSALCAGSIMEEKPCEKTVVLWTTDENGKAVSRVLTRGNTSCNVYVDPSFPNLNDSEKQNMLLGSGCSDVTFFSSINPVPQGGYQNVAPQEILPNAGHVQPLIQKPLQASQVQRALQLQESQQTNHWWIWLIVIFLFLIIVGVVIYLYARGS